MLYESRSMSHAVRVARFWHPKLCIWNVLLEDYARGALARDGPFLTLLLHDVRAGALMTSIL